MEEESVKEPDVIDGQLNPAERRFITNAILNAPQKPQVALEVGTWLGGGSTLHILRALEKNGTGHLYGIEADSSIYQRMLENIRQAAPAAANRFTPIFGFSEDAIPPLLAKQAADFKVDFVFLDRGNNPMEQITEFRLLDKYIPVGGQLLMHDARKRKGKFLVPYLTHLDNWETELHDFSEMGLFHAKKPRRHHRRRRGRRPDRACAGFGWNPRKSPRPSCPVGFAASSLNSCRVNLHGPCRTKYSGIMSFLFNSGRTRRSVFGPRWLRFAV